MSTSTNPCKVMLVEDHKLLSFGLKSLFEKFDFIKVIADVETGKEAIEKVKAVKPNVILMDIGLPDISGITATRKILEQEPSIRIIMLTSHISESEANESFSAGANAYALKDINTDFLANLICSVNEGAIWIDPKIAPLMRNKNHSIIPQKQFTRAGFKSQHANLTQREYEVLKLLVDGCSNNEIAHILTISDHTAKAHVCNIMQKLLVEDRTQAAVKAIKEGII